MTERGLIVAAAQLIGTRRHVDAPSAGQVVGAVEFGQHDRVVAQRGTDDAVTAPAELFDQPVQTRAVEHDGIAGCHVTIVAYERSIARG